MTISTTAPSTPSPAAAATEPVAKAARKPAKKPAAKQPAASAKKAPAKAARSTAPTAEPSFASAAGKEGKGKKPKLVRDSFTIPKDEYAAIETLKQRCTALAQPVKKSELLRAGLKVLSGMSDAALRKAVQAVPSIKTGRPKAQPDAAPAKPAPAPKKSAARP